jgi:hypothetical protein
MKRTERATVAAPDDTKEQPVRAESSRPVGQKVLFNTTHQPVPYTAPDGVTIKYIDPKSRLVIPESELSDELRAHIRSEVLLDETSATE